MISFSDLPAENHLTPRKSENMMSVLLLRDLYGLLRFPKFPEIYFTIKDKNIWATEKSPRNTGIFSH
ncbi:hypothetical protein OU798_01505 [Prolixibacteraceae bacterium Z1-6]|uniref:Uncharacterized protein n=1 Tax=Draconibacterium aestuarii TaxID=2998507 RepID=A0A9X3F261_9BACT|nr:hypothetical protein [Prolixibacteraceae bacterium Z1-6]